MRGRHRANAKHTHLMKALTFNIRERFRIGFRRFSGLGCGPEAGASGLGTQTPVLGNENSRGRNRSFSARLGKFRQAFPSLRPAAQFLVAKWFTRFEGVGDALQGLAFAAEADEGLALEVEEVLLADQLRGGERAAGENIGELAPHDGVVFADEFAAEHHVDGELSAGKELLAENADGWRLG